MQQKTPRRGQRQGQRLVEERNVAADWLKYHIQKFEETKNPVHAWHAVADCLSYNLKLPDAIRDYLLAVALKIAGLSRDSAPKAGAIDRAVAGAVGLRGGPKSNPFTAVHEPAHGLKVALEVYLCHSTNWANQRNGLEGTHDWGSIFSEVAETHHKRCNRCQKPMSAATVKRYWYRHAVEVIPPHLIENSKSQKLDDILR